VGFTTWQLAPHDTGRFAWLVDTAKDLSELEENLNHFSEQGFGVHRILSAPLQTEQSAFRDRRPSIGMTAGRGSSDRNRIVMR
jgi:hypothetical protein